MNSQRLKIIKKLSPNKLYDFIFVPKCEYILFSVMYINLFVIIILYYSP